MGNGKEANYIRTERNRAGMTLEKLAAKTGIPVSTLSRYQDSRDVPFSALQKIADVLSIPVSALTAERQIPDGEHLTYDQVNLELQATQQRNVYLAVICDSLRKTTRLLRIIAIILAIFLIYVFIDRFAFPTEGLFHAGI